MRYKALLALAVVAVPAAFALQSVRSAPPSQGESQEITVHRSPL